MVPNEMRDSRLFIQNGGGFNLKFRIQFSARTRLCTVMFALLIKLGTIYHDVFVFGGLKQIFLLIVLFRHGNGCGKRGPGQNNVWCY